MGLDTEAVSSSAMMRNVLLKTCSLAAVMRARSIAAVLSCSDPNTMAAMTATSAVANNTSTRVKPLSEACTGCCEPIGVSFEHFIRSPSFPENLDLDLTNSIQRCGGDDTLPPI